ncbi:MAG: DUF167 domain-containing protein [Deltaproteobacteria bacterium]|jgi:uncharacterized protein (TIGR00251 family)|nr:DUF167 domain-containing protein [Deltaproteobacteria bacterium]
MGAPDSKFRLEVRLTPRASKDRLLGFEGEVLRVSSTAPPVEGQANKSLAKFLAKILGVAPSRVTLERGLASRQKTVAIEGLSKEEVLEKLKAALGQNKSQEQAKSQEQDKAQEQAKAQGQAKA